jgi:uncharacterized protein YqjF (DUF2071 family)
VTPNPYAAALDETGHRAWPLPRTPWLMTMGWRDLLFLHWPVEPAVVAPLLPSGLTLDTFDGKAWLSVVPFRMVDVGPRPLARLRAGMGFAELNVRTYARLGQRTGVWFFSLDAASRLAVRAARSLFALPYYFAGMRCERVEGGWIEYESERRDPRGSAARFRARYRPTGGVYTPAADSLDAWLTNRLCLFAHAPRRGLLVGEIHHRPWPLQPAEVELSENGMAAAAGIALPSTPPLAQFAGALDVVAWAPVAAATPGSA